MKSLRIGVAGLGTVGGGVIKILQQHAVLLKERCGVELVVSAVSARDKNRDRGINLDGITWYDDAVALASAPEVDVVVELIGGSEGVAYTLCEQSLNNKKHVVTANKALLAHHGVVLAKLAENHNKVLAFEAAVAGGIPIVKALKEGLAANQIKRVCGIMNGTGNYILTTMEDTGRDFLDVLQEAQELGYAEADPSFDVDGIDTAHKLALLTSLAYGIPVNFDAVYVEGIREISVADIKHAAELGYKVKLLGICSETPDGIEQRVHPCMIPLSASLAGVGGVNNAIFVEGDFVGKTMFEGPGAGEGATASAVVADIMDIASNRHSYVFNVPVERLKERPLAPISARVGEYYVRLVVLDKPGVIAEITDVLQDNAISLEAVQQKAHNPEEPVDLVLVTHETPEASMQKALEVIAKIDAVKEQPRIIRIEKL